MQAFLPDRTLEAFPWKELVSLLESDRLMAWKKRFACSAHSRKVKKPTGGTSAPFRLKSGWRSSTNSSPKVPAMKLSKDLKEFIGLLNSRKVKYVVLGGYAVAYHGHL